MIDKTKNYRIWTKDAFQCEVVFNILKQLGSDPVRNLDHYIGLGCVAMYFHRGRSFSYSNNLDITTSDEEAGKYDSYIKMDWFEFYRAYTEGVING